MALEQTTQADVAGSSGSPTREREPTLEHGEGQAGPSLSSSPSTSSAIYKTVTATDRLDTLRAKHRRLSNRYRKFIHRRTDLAARIGDRIADIEAGDAQIAAFRSAIWMAQMLAGTGTNSGEETKANLVRCSEKRMLVLVEVRNEVWKASA